MTRSVTPVDRTLNELRQIFRDNNLEYFIKKSKDGIVKVHFMYLDDTVIKK